MVEPYRVQVIKTRSAYNKLPTLENYKAYELAKARHNRVVDVAIRGW